MKQTRLFSLLFFLLILIAFGARLIHLQADFPTELTWSGLLYTDEGWYSRNAAAACLTGNWHVEGDFNPAVNTPLFFAFQSLIFRFLGFGLISARLMVVTFSILLGLVVYYLLAAHISRRAGAIGLLLLGTNYTWFAFNRLAILEIPMIFFITLALALLLHPEERNRTVTTIHAALCFAGAMLIKTSAMFALPVLLAAVLLTQKRPFAKSLQQSGVFLVVLAAVFLVYWFLLAVPYWDDFRFFIDLNIASRIEFTIGRMIDSSIKSVYFGKYLSWFLYPVGMFYAGLCFMLDPKFRRNRLVLCSALWTVSLLLMIALNHYFPPRYYLPLMVPLTILTAIVADDFLGREKISPFAWAFLILISFSAAYDGARIIRYLAFPSYSFVEMARNMKARIESGGDSHTIILGYQANQIGLATGIESINDKHGTKSLEWRIQRYRPNYYVRWGNFDDYLPILDQFYDVKLIATYDVFGNYYEGNPLRFYALTAKSIPPEPKDESNTESPLPPGKGEGR